MFNNKQSISLVRGIFSRKFWLQDARGKKISKKFILNQEYQVGNFVVLETSEGTFVYNDRCETILHQDTEEVTGANVCRISANVYSLELFSKELGDYSKLYSPAGELLSTNLISEAYDFGRGLLGVCDALQGWGITDEKLNWIVNPLYEEVYNDKSNRIVGIYKKTTDIITIENMKVVSMAHFDGAFATYMPHDMVLLSKDKKYGVSKITSEVIIPVKYNYIEMVEIAGKVYFLVAQDGLYGLLDVNGNVCTDCIYHKIKIADDKAVGIRRQIIETNEEISLIGKEE